MMKQISPTANVPSAGSRPQHGRVGAAWRWLGMGLAGSAWAATACLPAEDLSSYSEAAPALVDAANGDAPTRPGSRTAERAPGGDGSGDAAASLEGGQSVATIDEASLSAPRGPASSTPDAGAPPAEVPCDSTGEFASPAGACYLVSGELTTWSEASERCRLWGGALASLDTPEEDALVGEHIVADTWIGLNDRAVEGVWIWDATGAESNWERWAEQQPDDFGGNEDCVEWRVDGRGWNDRPCGDLRAFSCER